MKKIAFSILNWNNVQDTIQCIDSILQSDYYNFDIYILDNGSDNHNDFLQLKSLYGNNKKIIINKSYINIGFTGGNNYNFKILNNNEYDFICLLNNDCIVEKGFIKDIINKIKLQKKDGIFGPVIRNPDGSIQSCGSFINLWTGSNPRLKKIIGEYQIVDCVSGSCFIISKKIFKEIGFLDNQYFAYREESDYCLRAKKKGYPIITINSNGIIHKEETATNKKKGYYVYLMFRNRILFLKKHANIIQYTVSWFILLSYILLVFPIVFGIKNYIYMGKGIIDGIKGKAGFIK